MLCAPPSDVYERLTSMLTNISVVAGLVLSSIAGVTLSPLAVESFLLGLLAGRVALEVTYLGFDRYKSSQSHRFSGSLLLLAIADCIASVLTPWCGSLPA